MESPGNVDLDGIETGGTNYTFKKDHQQYQQNLGKVYHSKAKDGCEGEKWMRIIPDKGDCGKLIRK